MDEITQIFVMTIRMVKPVNTPTLISERLILRKFKEDDLHDLYLILKDEEVNRFLPWFPVKDMVETKAFYKTHYQNKYELDYAYAYAIC